MAESPTPAQPIVRDVVLDVDLPGVLPTDRVQIRRIQILPGHPVGLHIHNGPVVGSVLEGSVIFEVEGEAQSVLKPGDVFYEPEAARIAHFDAGPDGATFLAYFLLRAGQEPTMEFPDQ
jgi:quercetin dioxygenase-like cupin family protein